MVFFVPDKSNNYQEVTSEVLKQESCKGRFLTNAHDNRSVKASISICLLWRHPLSQEGAITRSLLSL